MEAPDQTNINLFQQIGNIQGTLTALIKNLSDFQTEFRLATNDQNQKIADLRKEVAAEIKSLSDQVKALEEFKANFEGAKSEAKKNARLSGGVSGGTIGIVGALVVELIKYYLSLHK